VRFAAAIVCLLGAAASAPAGSLNEPMVQLTLRGQHVEGSALAWNNDEVLLLGRDGRLWRFDPQDASQFHKSADRFSSLPISELRAGLLQELGKGFDISGTGHYLVAHPQGQRDLWAQRFEDLYRAALVYFSVRGFRPEEPPFPLIGIVCHSREEFQRYAASQGVAAPRGVLGFYSRESNRIILYDVGAGRSDEKEWQQNASVLIHEATHQTAFNIGVHSRFVPPPLWVAEGVATLFEAPGVYDSGKYRRQRDRLNVGRLEQFRQGVLPKHRPEVLTGIIASDQLFRAAPSAAYAEAWALTFYLVETQPQKYFDYLGRTARRAPLSTSSAAERTADFTAVFGSEWPMFEAHFLRFIRGLSANQDR